MKKNKKNLKKENWVVIDDSELLEYDKHKNDEIDEETHKEFLRNCRKILKEFGLTLKKSYYLENNLDKKFLF